MQIVGRDWLKWLRLGCRSVRARKALIVSSQAASMRIKISEGQNVEELDRRLEDGCRGGRRSACRNRDDCLRILSPDGGSRRSRAQTQAALESGWPDRGGPGGRAG